MAEYNQIGQIVYRLEDYENSDNYITEPANTDIYGNIFSGKAVIKLGIQAPYGTQFKLEEEDEAMKMVGRTGIYEIDDGVGINYLSFVKPKIYKLDKQGTVAKLGAGIEGLENAETTRALKMAQLVPGQENYWEKYITIQKEYQEAYDLAMIDYTQGINGIYTETGEGDLKNIIIDYVYKDINGGEE